MLAELREDNLALAGYMRETQSLCSEYGDVATTSLLETWIDEAERRVWLLFRIRATRLVCWFVASRGPQCEWATRSRRFAV